MNSDRSTELRHALVSTVDAAAYQRRMPRALIATASIAAFALAGVATGGAVAAGYNGTGDSSSEQLQYQGAYMRFSTVGTHAQLFGDEVLLEGSDTTTIDLGDRPEGAESLAVAFACVDAGAYDVAIDGEFQMGSECSDADLSSMNSGGSLMPVTEGQHTVTISGPGRYVFWAQWATENPIPPVSAAQTAAMADGIVSRDEYLAGFDRFVACMTGAGYSVDGGNREAVILSYATPGAAADDGTDWRCYVPEFRDVDEAWQIAHEDESETTDLLRDCLTTRGITPLPTSAEINKQLADNGIDVLDCLP